MPLCPVSIDPHAQDRPTEIAGHEGFSGSCIRLATTGPEDFPRRAGGRRREGD